MESGVTWYRRMALSILPHNVAQEVHLESRNCILVMIVNSLYAHYWYQFDLYRPKKSIKHAQTPKRLRFPSEGYHV